MKLFSSLFFALLFANLSGQTDTLVRKEMGINCGYVHYGSIDELFTPFIYSGNTTMANLFFRRASQNSRFRISIQYASMLRSPKNVNVPAYYNIISYDNPKVYAFESEKEFKDHHTVMFELKFSYYRKTRFHFIKNDFLSIGLSNENGFVATQIINNPELITISMNPGFCYEIPFKNQFSILFESNITFFAMSIRAPYAGASAQLSDNYNSAYYWDYISDNLQFDFINTYLHPFSCIQFEKKFHNRLKLSLNYRFSYFNVERPRRLTSVLNVFGIGCSINFGKHGKD